MSDDKWEQIFDLLESDKPGSRQDGLAQLRDRKEQCSDLELENLDRSLWHSLFVSLCTTVVKEQNTLSQKGNSVAERRMRDAVAILRSFAEKGYRKWSRKTTGILIPHILDSLKQGERLNESIALDYIKILGTICSFQPHLDFLIKKREHWVKILSLGFALVLGDNLKTSLDDEVSSESQAVDNPDLSPDGEIMSRKRPWLGSPVKQMSVYTTSQPLSPEQIEFVNIIANVLHSSRIRIVSQEHPRLAGAILERWRRYFSLYKETSAHIDALNALQSTLEILCLNMRDMVIEFGVSVWDDLLRLFSTKVPTVRETLLCILKLLFPYVTHEKVTVDRANLVNKLLQILLPEHNMRGGFEKLSLEAIRLEVVSTKNKGIFVAKTFREGFHFSSSQANAWAYLELIADSIKEMFIFSEMPHVSTPDHNSSKRKRVQYENPIKPLLQSITSHNVLDSKILSLQSLLFLIERHWDVFHSEIKTEILDSLYQMISSTTEDNLTQSWSYCCISAIAISENEATSSSYWDKVWVHAMRRINTSGISRYACHVANTLLICKKVASSQILLGIESRLHDINIQGPPSLCDSVCALLAHCTRIASQDISLYKLHLDDKLLSWLIKTWVVHDSTSGYTLSKLGQYTIGDILMLVEVSCGYKNNNHVPCPILTVLCPVTEFEKFQTNTFHIQNFILNGTLLSETTGLESRDQNLSRKYFTEVQGGTKPLDSRARKVSGFLIKSLESFIATWGDGKEIPRRLAPEAFRRTIDFAILAICFESSSVLNGLSSDRRTILAACKVMSLATPHLTDCQWTMEEVLLILSGLLPLCSLESVLETEQECDALVSSSKSTGVKELGPHQKRHFNNTGLEPPLHSIIWQIVDDSLSVVIDTVERLLKRYIWGEKANIGDGFDPIQTNTQSTSLSIVRLVSVCVDIMASFTVQRTDKEIKRYQTLMDITTKCNDKEKFIIILRSLLKRFRQNTSRLTVSNFYKLMSKMEGFLAVKTHERSDLLQVAAIELLDSSLHIWLQIPMNTDMKISIRAIIAWLVGNKEILSWKIGDALIRFLSHYLALDPLQKFILDGHKLVPIEERPDVALPLFLKDDDIRVRFTAARACANIFSTEYILHQDPMLVYSNIREQLCTVLSNYEHMVTRFICLADILITSSAVRRGPYWHLLETCLYTHEYTVHIESVLRLSASRMGILRFPDLFESYASQIAYSIRISEQDFFRLPPRLLGYRDLKECAEATFLAFSPTNLLVGLADNEDIVQGNGPFPRHCRLIHLSPFDGLNRCFAEAMGYQIVFWAHNQQNDQAEDSELVDMSGLLPMLQERFAGLGPSEYLSNMISQNIDGILYTIIRSGGDLDYRDDGIIAKTLSSRNLSVRTVDTFRTLTSFRNENEFNIHSPNLPAFSTSVILDSIDWLAGYYSSVKNASSLYHILHRLFADITNGILINEQLRSLTYLCLWVSYSSNLFNDPSLLMVLMTGAAACLPQIELTTFAQGILHWAFERIREVRWDCPHLIKILLRTCMISSRFISSSNQVESDLGKNLKQWLEHQILFFGQTDIFRRRIWVSLAAWPCELPENLSGFLVNISLQDLSSILEDPYLSSHKFKLVSRLSSLTLGGTIKLPSFANRDFWRLKESIPSSGILYEEMNDFTSLLLSHSGNISNKAIVPDLEQSMGARFLGLIKRTPNINKGTLIKHATVLSLLDLLVDQSASVVQNAHRTLRLIAFNEPLDSMENVNWPPEYHNDILHLDFCPVNEPVQFMELDDISLEKYSINSHDFETWISELTIFFAGVLSKRDPFYAKLFDILRNNIGFSEQMFPILVYSLISDSGESRETQQSADAQKKLSEYFSDLLKREDLDVRCHSSIVNLVLFLRNFNSRDPSKLLDYNRWLDLDFLLLGRSSIKCGAYTTAVLFLELAAEYQQITTDQPQETEQILFDIYSHIDEPDGFYGIKTGDLQNFLLRRFQHENQWGKVINFQGANFEAGYNTSRLDIVHSLHSIGFNNLAMSTFEALEDGPNHSKVLDLKYSMGWRIGSWDIPEPPEGVGINSAIYIALKTACTERNSESTNLTIFKCFEEELMHLKRLGNENLVEIRQVIQNLMCLSQIRKWEEEAIQNDLISGYIDVNEERWKEFYSPSPFRFEDLKSVLETRISLFRSARMREQRVQIGDLQSDLTRTLFQLERECLLQLSEASREANQPQTALNSVVSALKLDKNSDFKVHQEFANVLWLQNEQTFAVKYMKAELSRFGGSSTQNVMSNLQKALALAKLGEWSSEACLEKPEHIDEQYFTPAINLLRVESHVDSTSNDARASIFHKCALFAEKQYHGITGSEEIRRLHVYSERKSKEIADRDEALRDPRNRSVMRELAQHQKKAKALQAQDVAQLNEFLNARNKYLQQAISLLSLCLQTSDNFDSDSTIRLCSLWFANFNSEVKDIMASVSGIASRKFVFLARQLTARLSNSDSANLNQVVLKELILRMCTEHPFHSLYQLYSLQSAQYDKGSTSRRRTSSLETENTQADRISAASTLFEQVLALPNTTMMAKTLRVVCDAYLQWAKYPLKDNPSMNRASGEVLTIPKSMVIRRLQNFRVPVATANTPLDPTMRYEDCVWIDHYKPEFTLAGGINLPKICVCFGSDGEKYKQLFKGEGDDDLRQDAVMEQVFELCNQVLIQDQQTRKRDLRIRSYKVIPLAPQAGLLEFVGNTIPLHWVTKAHSSYHPNDYSFKNCSLMLGSVRKGRDPSKDPAMLRQALIETFKDIQDHFHPVMRHFFTEKHKNPQLWFEMRLKYSRSVAATSIVGHILGLGDRHLSNILIDQGSGEVIHIDLGIAFEQGKLLPIPERVPFRLTADMVDGFGISGTDGVFRRCAEETLRVLRDGSDVIKTVLEVFKYDPLHSWTMSAMKIRKAQEDTGVSNPQHHDTDPLGTGIGLDLTSAVEAEAADRALSGVARKLGKSLSVEYTVNELISEATDISNLALMFTGWSPFC